MWIGTGSESKVSLVVLNAGVGPLVALGLAGWFGGDGGVGRRGMFLCPKITSPHVSSVRLFRVHCSPPVQFMPQSRVVLHVIFFLCVDWVGGRVVYEGLGLGVSILFVVVCCNVMYKASLT